MEPKIDPGVIRDLEERIKRGDAQSARKFLKTLNIKAINRKHALGLANLCRRVNMITLGLRILNPILRSEKQVAQPPSEMEKAEYAVLLLRIGAIEESTAILRSLDPGSCPEASLYLAFCAFTRWNYGSAIPHLERYISSGSISDYQRLVGRVNLAAALVHEERFREAKTLLDAIQEESYRKEYLLLYGNSLEIRSQLEISSGDYRGARKFIRLASERLTKAHSLDAFFVRKWDAIMTCLERDDASPLKVIRAEAFQLSHWETVRECDFYSAMISRNRALFLKVYFGTPFPSYREKLVRKCDWMRDLPDFYIHSADRRPAKVLDICGPEAIPVGHLMHRTLILLSRDFYRPQRMGALFSGLYPREYFHPHSSPDRIHQLIRRIRRWIEANRLGLSLEESSGGYTLGPADGFGIRVPRALLPLSTEELVFHKLREVFGTRDFTAREARQALDCSYTSGNRLISWALHEKRLFRGGSGPKTTYRILARVSKE